MSQKTKKFWQDIANDLGVSYQKNDTIIMLARAICGHLGVKTGNKKDATVKNEAVAAYEDWKAKNAEKAEKPKAEKKKPAAKKTTKKKTTTKKKPAAKKPATKKDTTKKPAAKKPAAKKSDSKLTRLQELQKECQKLDIPFGMQQNEKDLEQMIRFFKKKNGIEDTSKKAKGESGKVKAAKESAETEEEKLNRLREECGRYGMAWTTEHNANDLQQLLDAFKLSKGVPDTPPLIDAPEGGETDPNNPVGLAQQNLTSDPMNELPNLMNDIQDTAEPVKPKAEIENFCKMLENDFSSGIFNIRPASVEEIKNHLSSASYNFRWDIVKNDEESTVVIQLSTIDGDEAETKPIKVSG